LPVTKRSSNSFLGAVLLSDKKEIVYVKTLRQGGSYNIKFPHKAREAR
jgi:hypothetical protein